MSFELDDVFMAYSKGRPLLKITAIELKMCLQN